MDKQAAIQFAIRELGSHKSRDGVVRALCEGGRFAWADAEAIVNEVEIDHGGKVARRQAPLLLVLAVGAILGGIFLTTRAIIATMNGVMIIVVGGGVPYLGNIAFFVTGIAMILGGGFGIWQTIAAMFRE